MTKEALATLDRFPAAMLTQHIAVLGKTGSGKTSTAKKIIEQVVEDGARVCVLDTVKSDWWGLISSANGKKPGLPFKILGGPHGHMPIHSDAGKALGKLVAQGKLPLTVIDMVQFEPGGVQHFFIAFSQSLMSNMRGVLYLVIEEAHEIAPKERTGVGAENMSIYWAKKLATAGRSRGIRLIVCTQATQQLHNRVLGSCDTLIAHRMTAPADQKPIENWLKANVGDKARRESIENTLASQKTGQGWLCSSEAGVFEHVQFGRIATFDNTATPDEETARAEIKSAPVDMDELRTIVGDAIKVDEDSDPEKLRARVAELNADVFRLTGEVNRLTEHGIASASSSSFDQGYSDGYAQGQDHGWAKGAQTQLAADDETFKAVLNKVVHQGWHLVEAVEDFAKRIPELTGPYRQACVDTPSMLSLVKAPPAQAAPSRPAPATLDAWVDRMQRPVPVPKAQPTADGGESSITGTQTQLLRTLAWWERMGNAQPTKEQVAAVCGWKITGKYVTNILGASRSAGLIDYPEPGKVTMTAMGRTKAPTPDMRVTLLDSLRANLDGPQNAVVNKLLDNGRRMKRADLAAALSWTSAKYGTNVMGEMRTLSIIDYEGRGDDQVVLLSNWVR